MRQDNPRLTTERRAHVRYAARLKASCRLLGTEADAVWAATVTDLSRVGAALLMGREAWPGAVFAVALEGHGGRFSQPLLMRVRNARPLSGRDWLAGCTFVKPLTDDELHALLLASAPGGE